MKLRKFEVITTQEKGKWYAVLSKILTKDVYYSLEYAFSFSLHGDGVPLLLYYQGETCDVCYVVMKQDIAGMPEFSDVLKKNEIWDIQTPYGYGGPLVSGDFNEKEQLFFGTYLKEYCNSENIITQFIRFHPLLENYKFFSNLGDIRYLKDTIFMDTRDRDMIFKNMDTKNRNMIRKAIKNDVKIFYDTGEHAEQFRKIYEETMDRDHAEEYYYFEKEYYEYLVRELKNNIVFFYAVYNNNIVAAAIFLYDNCWMHYHLSGVCAEYRKLAPTNLLLYEAALWANDKGLEKLHLGGGILPNDSLFGFKKQFSNNGYSPFYVGRTIFDKEKYNYLLNLRKSKCHQFDINNQFMIQYRR